MANYSDSVIRIQDLCGVHTLATAALVGRFYNNEHRALLESYEWSRKKQEILIVIVAQESTGTFSVTNGLSTTVGTGASLSSADVGKYIRFSGQDSYYVIKSYSDPTVTLGDLNGTTVAYQGSTNTLATYVMFQRFYSLGTGISSILSIQYKERLKERTVEWLDGVDPGRKTTGDPLYFIRGPFDQSGTSDLVRVEFYPRPTSATAITAQILKGHTDLSGTTNPIVPSGPLEWMAAADTCFYLFAKTKDPKWITLTDKYREMGVVSLEKEMVLDAKKFGLIPAMRDVGAQIDLSVTDYGIDKDTGI